MTDVDTARNKLIERFDAALATNGVKAARYTAARAAWRSLPMVMAQWKKPHLTRGTKDILLPCFRALVSCADGLSKLSADRVREVEIMLSRAHSKPLQRSAISAMSSTRDALFAAIETDPSRFAESALASSVSSLFGSEKNIDLLLYEEAIADLEAHDPESVVERKLWTQAEQYPEVCRAAWAEFQKNSERSSWSFWIELYHAILEGTPLDRASLDIAIGIEDSVWRTGANAVHEEIARRTEDAPIPGQFWIVGPAEILNHALDLLETGAGTDHRISLILIDNAVELIAKTYFSLPSRISGLSIKRTQRVDIFRNFFTLMNGLEEHASQELKGLNLGEVELLHKQRNQLYHEGANLTVEVRIIERYAYIAKFLFRALLGSELERGPAQPFAHAREFLLTWVDLERRLAQAALDDGSISPKEAMRYLVGSTHDLSGVDIDEFNELSQLRKKIVHGRSEVVRRVTTEETDRLYRLLARVVDVADAKKGMEDGDIIFGDGVEGQ